MTTRIAAYDDQAIWGVGVSGDAARADAMRWVNAEDAAELDASMKTAPMSADLAEHVATMGGNCSFELRDGMLELAADRSMTAKHTPGPWLRIGTFVYALMHAGWRHGEEQFKNRISIQISADRDCPPEELEAVAALVQSAPDLLEALKSVEDQGYDMQMWLSKTVRAAIAKATGENA